MSDRDPDGRSDGISVPIQRDGAGSRSGALWEDMQSRMAERRRQWDEEVERMRQDFFRVRPLTLGAPGGQQVAVPSSDWTLVDGDRKSYRMWFDVSEYLPDEVDVRAQERRLVVTARHHETTGGQNLSREFSRSVDIPRAANQSAMSCTLTSQGRLQVEAPVVTSSPPGHGQLTAPGHGSSRSSYASSSSVSSSSSGTGGFSPRLTTNQHSPSTSWTANQSSPHRMENPVTSSPTPVTLINVPINIHRDVISDVTRPPATVTSHTARTIHGLSAYTNTSPVTRTTGPDTSAVAQGTVSLATPVTRTTAQSFGVSPPGGSRAESNWVTAPVMTSSTATPRTTNQSRREEFFSSTNHNTHDSGGLTNHSAGTNRPGLANHRAGNNPPPRFVSSASAPARTYIRPPPANTFAPPAPTNPNIRERRFRYGLHRHTQLSGLLGAIFSRFVIDIGEDFEPGDVTVKTVDQKLVVRAKHEERVGGKTSLREFSREFELPPNIDPFTVTAALGEAGKLSVEAPYLKK